MRRVQLSLLPLILFFIGSMACKTDESSGIDTENNKTSDTMSSQPPGGRIRIGIGSRTFSATLLNNPTATEFKTRLPITVLMNELNGNEKFYNFPKDLPANATNPGTIQPGDLMLYNSTTLVLFYQSFPTSYRYTKLGRVDNTADLAASLGSGSVTVTFELK